MSAIRDLRIEGTDDTIVDMRKEIPGIDPTVRTLAMTMRTDLNAFSEVEAYSLMYVGYCACGQEMDKLQGQMRWRMVIGEEGRGRVALHVHSFLCGDADAGVFGIDGPEGEEAFLDVEPDVVSCGQLELSAALSGGVCLHMGPSRSV